VAAWRETFKPHVASLRRGVKKNKPHATTQRRNEKLKNKNKIAFQSIPEKIC
jgi:hypothetical protein